MKNLFELALATLAFCLAIWVIVLIPGEQHIAAFLAGCAYGYYVSFRWVLPWLGRRWGL